LFTVDSIVIEMRLRRLVVLGESPAWAKVATVLEVNKSQLSRALQLKCVHFRPFRKSHHHLPHNTSCRSTLAVVLGVSFSTIPEAKHCCTILHREKWTTTFADVNHVLMSYCPAAESAGNFKMRLKN
ncbi:hypothetical protein T03_6341, partial [Trichinella britovi]